MNRTCARCGVTQREPHVRPTIANREREANQDGREFVPPAFAVEDRCTDRDACRARVRRDREAERGTA